MDAFVFSFRLYSFELLSVILSLSFFLLTYTHTVSAFGQPCNDDKNREQTDNRQMELKKEKEIGTDMQTGN